MNLTKIPPASLLPAVVNTHPALALHHGQRYLLYRHEQPVWNANTRIVRTICGEDWQPIYPGTVLDVKREANAAGELVIEDARLFEFRGELMFSATDRRRIGIGMVAAPKAFQWIDIPDALPVEKNWQFFEHGGELCGIRWIAPMHEVYHIDLQIGCSHKATPVLKTTSLFDWHWGMIHGGTPPVRFDDLFVSFFHSFTLDFPPHEGQAVAAEKTADPQRKVNFAAPYAFEAKSPFRVVMAPNEPMLWPRLQRLEDRSLNKDYTVFPVGLVREGDQWTCGYGDDRFCWLAQFDTAELFAHLRPI